jgi:hypothetical protein
MSDELFASLVTVGLVAALSLWVPTLDVLRHFIRNRVIHRQKD